MSWRNCCVSVRYWTWVLCSHPLTPFGACALMMWFGCVVPVHHQRVCPLACASMPPCAGTTLWNLCATSGCTGEGWEDRTQESLQVSWSCWPGPTPTSSGWRSCSCLSRPACWSCWWSRWPSGAPSSRRAGGEEDSSATQNELNMDFIQGTVCKYVQHFKDFHLYILSVDGFCSRWNHLKQRNHLNLSTVKVFIFK